MEWWLILIVVLVAIPLILIPVAFVWYLNVSGLYRVMREARQRQKRRARAMRAAEEPIRSEVVSPEVANRRETT